MRCPFLREAQVKFCRASAYSKMIVRSADAANGERCSTVAWTDCPSAKQRHEDAPLPSRCPFLHESLVQYCSGAPVSKFVPYSDAQMARCNDDRHQYCDVRLSLAGGESIAGPEEIVEGVAVPDRVHFAPNHLWLDVAEDGHWHAGIDAFIARLTGPVDRLAYLTTRGTQQPVAVLSVAGADLLLTFPLSLPITDVNSRLRSQTRRLVDEPYTGGWLFEGTWPAGAGEMAFDGLRSGPMARRWMESEVRRLNTFVHERYAATSGTMNDGGSVVPGVFHQLDRQDIFSVYTEFLTPYEPSKEKR